MKRTGVTTKIWLSIGVFAIGYLASVSLEQVQNYFLEHRLLNTADSLFPAAQSAQSAEARFQRMVKLQRDGILTEDTAALDAAREEGQKIVQDLSAMVSLKGLSPERASSVASTLTAAQDLVDSSDRTYRAAAAAHGNLTDEIQNNLRQAAQKSDAVKAKLENIVSSTANDLRVELNDAAQKTRRQRWIGLIAFLATLAIAGIFVNLTIERAIRRPLSHLTASLNETAQQIEAASSQLSSTSQTLSHSATSQAAALEETAATSEEVSSMARRNAQGAGQARELMQTANQNFKAVDQAQAQLVSAMAEINDSSTRISKIIRVIEEIAFQTNILALNAAVEAARAGQFGMGFTVVAEEVRNLAQRCTQAVKDTAALIDDSVSRTNSGSERLDVVTKLLEKNRAISAQVEQLISGISSASQEQVSGVEQISRTVNATSQGTQVTATHADSSARTVAELNDQAKTLSGVVVSLEEMIGA
jgi:methyl-accepting chemotaxis protein